MNHSHPNPKSATAASRMRRTTLTALLLALAGTAFASDHDAVVDRLAGGTWTADQRSRGGLGERFSFHRDGEFTYSFGQIVDMHYTVKGQTLHAVTRTQDGRDESMDFAYRQEGDRMWLQPAGSKDRMELTRAKEFTPPDAESPLGAWDFRDPSGRHARLRLSSDGQAQMLITLTNTSGRYEIDGDRLTLSPQGAAAESGRYSIDGQTLRLNWDRDGEPKAKTFSHFLVR